MPRIAPLLAALALACQAQTVEPTTTGDTSTSTTGPAEATTGSSSSSEDESTTSGSDSGAWATTDAPTASTSDTTTSGGTTPSTTDPSTTGPAAVCGDGVVDPGEACDDGNDDNTDACIDTCAWASCGDGWAHLDVEACDDGDANSDVEPDACRTDCTAPSCGDGVVDSDEECDDGNGVAGDGCDAACVVELECGKTFTTTWCKQVGPTDQHTRCGAVEDRGRTCVNPEIKYGTNTGGIPSQSALADAAWVAETMTAWCQQLGFATWASLDLGDRDCTSPAGPVGMTKWSGEDAGWVFAEGGNGNDGYWRGPAFKLNEGSKPCEPGLAILAITCQ